VIRQARPTRRTDGSHPPNTMPSIVPPANAAERYPAISGPPWKRSTARIGKSAVGTAKIVEFRSRT
jgi:hypothetical protein